MEAVGMLKIASLGNFSIQSPGKAQELELLEDLGNAVCCAIV